MFKFIWNFVYEPVSRKTLFLPFKDGGLNIPNIEYVWYSILLSHVQNIVLNYDAPWFYFSKFWIGFTLRRYNKSCRE